MNACGAPSDDELDDDEDDDKNEDDDAVPLEDDGAVRPPAEALMSRRSSSPWSKVTAITGGILPAARSGARPSVQQGQPVRPPREQSSVGGVTSWAGVRRVGGEAGPFSFELPATVKRAADWQAPKPQPRAARNQNSRPGGTARTLSSLAARRPPPWPPGQYST
jgi:hypothetical protein